MWYIHTTDYYLVIKRNEVLLHTIWMKLKNMKEANHKRPHDSIYMKYQK